MKIYDYLLYIRDMKEFTRHLDAVNDEFELECQYEIERPCGSVTEGYLDNQGRFKDTKSIIGIFSLYEHQKEAFQELLDNAYNHPLVYSIFDKNIYNELINKYPKILDAKDKFDWGIDAKNWDTYPNIREISNGDVIEVDCHECYKSFQVCGTERETDGEKLQCPHCKTILRIEAEYSISLHGNRA